MIQHIFIKEDTYWSCVGLSTNVWNLWSRVFGLLISTGLCLQQDRLGKCLKHISNKFALNPVPSSSMTSIQAVTSHVFTHGQAGWRPAVHQPSWLDTVGLWLSKVTAWDSEDWEQLSKVTAWDSEDWEQLSKLTAWDSEDWEQLSKVTAWDSEDWEQLSKVTAWDSEDWEQLSKVTAWDSEDWEQLSKVTAWDSEDWEQLSKITSVIHRSTDSGVQILQKVDCTCRAAFIGYIILTLTFKEKSIWALNLTDSASTVAFQKYIK
jgi:hypothetical protein